MRILSVDEKGRVQLPKEIRELLKLEPGGSLLAETRKNSILLKKPIRTRRRRDPLIHDLNHPIKARRVLTKAELERIEDEMWLP